MDLPIHLAMTAGEFQSCRELPKTVAWMSCHFSSASLGLSNLPGSLPPESILILDDAFPMNEHDPKTIFWELTEFLQQCPVKALLLDFQRERTVQEDALVDALTALPCPVAAPPDYAREIPCGVFLPPCPTYLLPERYLKEWEGREIWLEFAIESHTLELAEDGCNIREGIENRQTDYWDEKLCCRYDLECLDDRAFFYLQRREEDLLPLWERFAALGVTGAVGLYQELGK